MQFVYCFKSEWLKKRRSLASWMVIIGAFLIPFVICVSKLVRYERVAAANKAPDFWMALWRTSWESTSLFLLPVGTILATSLITQLEYKNNTWKQLHATPQKFTTLYFAKLVVVIVMFLQFFVLFNIGIWLSAAIPSLLISGASYPDAPVPWSFFLKEDIRYFIEALPFVSLQYLLGLRYKNFLVPVGAGIVLWIVSMVVISWKWAWLIPYTYGTYHYLESGGRMVLKRPVDVYSMVYFLLFIIAGYVIYVSRKEKG